MSAWNNDTIQFARLIAEINATQEIDFAALAEAMDLTIEEVGDLFDRADEAWEKAKRDIMSADKATHTLVSL